LRSACKPFPKLEAYHVRRVHRIHLEQYSSETIVRSARLIRPTSRRSPRHELAGFDRALLAFHSTTPDAVQIGQHVLGITRKLKVMIAQRPGFTAPTLLAR
jgi:alkanesulfonate monooxygenase